MDDKDTFLTIAYRPNAWIHTCENRTTGKTEVTSQIGFATKNHRTVAGAKRYITACLRHSGPVMTTLLEYHNEVTQSNFEELEHITYTN